MNEKLFVFIALVIVVGLLLLSHQLFNWDWFQWHLFWPTLIIIIGLYFIFKRKGK